MVSGKDGSRIQHPHLLFNPGSASGIPGRGLGGWAMSRIGLGGLADRRWSGGAGDVAPNMALGV